MGKYFEGAMCLADLFLDGHVLNEWVVFSISIGKVSLRLSAI